MNELRTKAGEVVGSKSSKIEARWPGEWGTNLRQAQPPIWTNSQPSLPLVGICKAMKNEWWMEVEELNGGIGRHMKDCCVSGSEIVYVF
ncbi:hypothetical protein V6N13_050673 [Hibiscus sabdariffa]|uniref:Uncharacterized protein n=1 Tax=Hibiscus sabdariffa TaxID=183260 RepID=A0ABR2PI08_9ROSI